MKVKITDLTLDREVQQRTKMNIVTVRRYMEAMESMSDKKDFPPIIAFTDGESTWVADGFHRVFAARALKLEAIDADVKEGSKRDAILHAVGANDRHGLPRTNADKRKAAKTMLTDSEWREWSDKEIARQCAVSARFIGKIRQKIFSTVNGSQTKSKSGVRKCADGRIRNTANIGKQPAGEYASIFDKTLHGGTAPDPDNNKEINSINKAGNNSQDSRCSTFPEDGAFFSTDSPGRQTSPVEAPPGRRPGRGLIFAEAEKYPRFLMSVYTADEHSELSSSSALPRRALVDWKSEDLSGDIYEKGKITFGDSEGRTQVDGGNIRLLIAGSEEIVIDENGDIDLDDSAIATTGLVTAGNLAVGQATITSGYEFEVSGESLLDSVLLTGLTINIVHKTGAYTASATDDSITCDGTFTLSLPALSGITGKVYHVKNIGTGTITIDADGAETIDGAATQSLASQYDTITVIAGSSEWHIL